MSFFPDPTSKQSKNSHNSDGFNEQPPEQIENTLNLASNHDSSLSNKRIEKYGRGQKRKRGRPTVTQNLNKNSRKPQTREHLNQIHQRKLDNIIAYENALKKLRGSYKQFYSPFEQHDLKIDKKAVIQVLTDALKNMEERALRLRAAIRSVGVRHERNLFKYGVREQFGYIIEYLETGKVPKEIRYQFRELMEKDFSNIHQTEMHPTLV